MRAFYTEFFYAGGYMMWILLLIGITIIVLSIKNTIQLFRKDSSKISEMKNGINNIIFWGVMSLILGFFAHFHGIYVAMILIRRTNDISPAILASGYQVTLIPILSSLFIFLISALIWLTLRWRYNKLAL